MNEKQNVYLIRSKDNISVSYLSEDSRWIDIIECPDYITKNNLMTFASKLEAINHCLLNNLTNYKIVLGRV